MILKITAVHRHFSCHGFGDTSVGVNSPPNTPTPAVKQLLALSSHRLSEARVHYQDTGSAAYSVKARDACAGMFSNAVFRWQTFSRMLTVDKIEINIVVKIDL